MKLAKSSRLDRYKAMEHSIMGSKTPQNQDSLYGRHNFLVSLGQKKKVQKPTIWFVQNTILPSQ
jgi:hypothetical protein